MQASDLEKRHIQSLQQYKQRVKKLAQKQIAQDEGYLGRTMAMPFILIPESKYIAKLLFPIRKPSYQEMDEAIMNVMTDFTHPDSNDKDTKITEYLFNPYIYDREYIEDHFNEEEKRELYYIRQVILEYLTLNGSLDTLDARRIYGIIETLSFLPERKMDNLIYVLDYLIFKFDRLRQIEKSTKKLRQQTKRDFIDEIQYFPNYGIKYKQAFLDFQQRVNKW